MGTVWHLPPTFRDYKCFSFRSSNRFLAASKNAGQETQKSYMELSTPRRLRGRSGDTTSTRVSNKCYKRIQNNEQARSLSYNSKSLGTKTRIRRLAFDQICGGMVYHYRVCSRANVNIVHIKGCYRFHLHLRMGSRPISRTPTTFPKFHRW